MNRPFVLIGLSAALSAITGCSGMMENLRATAEAQYCNNDGAYQLGINHARENHAMDNSFANVCKPEVQPAVKAAYREGYTTGLAGVRQSPTTVQLNFGSATQNPKQYFCEVSAFMSQFSSWGATELEASQAAKAKCMARHHEMHCSSVQCRENR